MMANSLIAAVLLLVSIKLYLLYKERLNPGISKFYFCLMAWAVGNYSLILAYSLKNMFSLVVYYTVF